MDDDMFDLPDLDIPKSSHHQSINFFNDETFLPNFNLLEDNPFSEEEEDDENRPPTSPGQRRPPSELEMDEIRKYFRIPIIEAAKEMNVGLTGLKKRCRELGIRSWPKRKLQSIDSAIRNAKEKGLTSDVDLLEKYLMLLEEKPDLEFGHESIKKIKYRVANNKSHKI